MQDKKFEDLLNNPDRSLIEVYFDLQKNFEEKYGENTVVIMEVGSFFEVYGIENSEVKIGKSKEIAEILNLQLTRRNKSIQENSLKNPLLAGFPTAAFDRYIQRLIQENKYTLVLVRQAGEPPKVTRFVERILSPGVNFDYNIHREDNFVISLVVDDQKGICSVGYAALDVLTGKTFVQEMYSTREDPTLALDEVFKLLQSYPTSEILFTSAQKSVDEFRVKQYLEIPEDKIKMNTKRFSVSYQNEIFKQVYGIQSFLTPIEFLDFEKKPLISESLSLLFNFVIEHDYEVVKKLEKPKLIVSSSYLYLGNNPLEQLNVVSRDPSELTLVHLLNRTVTSMGSRLFRERLFHPLTQKFEIENRYNLCETLSPVREDIHRELRNVYDLERIARRIRLQRLHPFELNFLFDSLNAAENILQKLDNNKKIHDVIENFQKQKHNLKQCIGFAEKIFNFTETSRMSFSSLDGNFFRKGFSEQLDMLVEQERLVEKKLIHIQEAIQEILREHTGKQEDQFVEIRQMDKEGHFLSLTRSRFSLIEKKLKKSYVSIDGVVHAFSDFSFQVLTTNVKISGRFIEECSEQILGIQRKIIALTKELYKKQLSCLEDEYIDVILSASEFFSKIDVALSTLKAADEFQLVRPQIIETKHTQAFLEIHQVRHILVESREENGIYVPNDIFLGARDLLSEKFISKYSPEANRTGILLYGINSSGKSSLMKSIGMAVILAQSGMFVPAQSMRFSLFTELFTRIIAKDNFEKGLSSFGVEMMELKNIFNRCTPTSLILGDEISHGTETLSALALVTASIEHLVEKQSLFIFTTHLHQLVEYERIQRLKEVSSFHLAVAYNPQEDRLIFSRTLEPGSGSSIYGLEFAESLHIDPSFLRRAHTIRKELAQDFTVLEMLTQKKKSKYHSEIFLTLCAVCKNPVEDTHHIAPQESADEKGNIGHFHKNHKYNLLPLCKECHNKVHEGKLIIHGFVMTSKGLQVDFEEEKN